MALNWQTFRTRTISSLIFVAVMLGGLLWNQWSFLALFTIIHFGCWWEYLKLTEKIHNTVFHPYTKLGVMLMGYGLMLWFCGPSYHINSYGIKENISLPVSGAGFALLLIDIFQKTAVKLKAFGMAIGGMIYISLSWGLMMDLYNFHDIKLYDTYYVINASFIPVIIIASIWMNDTMAYLIGSMIGRTHFSKISPKKTLEGTIGGIILCILFMAFIFLRIFFSFHDKTISIGVGVIAFIVAITGTIGDLFESKIKRTAGVKDSGNMMPGHGGFLDRFDSLLFATPFVWLFVRFILT